MRPSVSVIVPVYNAKEYLPRCLDSIVSQTRPVDEIILVNDGSDDGSGKVCEHFSKAHTNVTLIHTENKGPAFARNLGLSIANSDFIYFSDADDWLSLDLIEKLSSGIIQNDADLAVCSFVRAETINLVSIPLNIAGAQKPYRQLKEFARGVPDALLRFGSLCNKMYINEIIKQNGIAFEDTNQANEDAYFNLAYADHINMIWVIDEPLYHYRVQPGRATMTNKSRPNAFEMNERLYQEIKGRIWGELTESERNRFNRHYLDKTIIVMKMLARDLDEQQAKREFKQIVESCTVNLALTSYCLAGSQSEIAIGMMKLQDCNSLYKYVTEGVLP